MAFKYFARVLRSYSTEQALQNQNFDFNSIVRYSVHCIGKYNFTIYLYNGTFGTLVAYLGAVL